jgi:cardiolipin hydrolase
MFFPSKQNEKELSFVLRRAEKTMDVCVFAFTNDRLRDAIMHAHSKGVKIRVISDDECSKFNGAEIYRLGIIGIPCTTDNNFRAHMHNKYVLIDSKILVTGSFNWTSQAVTMNQENLIVIYDTELVKSY